jgi:DNA-binding MarR family transcriptional regulator
MLVLLRTIAPQDLAAIDAWIDVHGTDDERKILKASLPSLPIGEAWLWSPGWPTVDGIFQRAQILPIETFDSGATPKPGEKRIEPKNLADVDLDALSRQMSATIEKAKAENPKELQKKIRELEAELKKSQNTRPAPAKAEIKTIEKLVVDVKVLSRLEKLVEKFHAAVDKVVEVSEAITQESGILNGSLSNARFIASAGVTPLHPNTQARRAAVPVLHTAARVPQSPIPRAPERKRDAVAFGDLKITPKQQDILDAIAWYESIGNPKPTNIQVGAIALIDATGGHFSNTVGPLSTAGLIERDRGHIWLTGEGRAVAKVPDNIATLDEYHNILRNRVRRARSASGRTVDVLNSIIKHGGAEVTTASIGEEVGIDHTGGHFSNTIGPLSTLGLIERNQGVVRPTDVLFPPGLS